MEYKAEKKKKSEFHDIDLILINEKTKAIYPAGRKTRERILEELMESENNPEEVFSHVGSVKSVAFSPSPFGTASFHIWPESNNSDVTVQNMNNGSIGASINRTQFNLFGALEQLKFNIGKDFLASTFISAELGIPFSFVRRASMGLTFEQFNRFVFPGMYLFERKFGFSFSWRKPSEDSLSFKMGAHRYVIDPFNYKGYDTRSLREQKNSIRVGYKRLLHRSADKNLKIHGLVDGIFFEGLKHDLVLGLDAVNKKKIEKFAFFPDIELENQLTTSLHMAGLGKESISMHHKHIFSNLRGFSNIDSNIPFSKIGHSLENEPISSELSFGLNSRFLLKNFNLFGKDTVYPMFHISNYGSLRNFGNLNFNSSTGVGFSVRTSGIDIEIMYNPLHYNFNNSKFNTKEYFQIRFNLGF